MSINTMTLLFFQYKVHFKSPCGMVWVMFYKFQRLGEVIDISSMFV